MASYGMNLLHVLAINVLVHRILPPYEPGRLFALALLLAVLLAGSELPLLSSNDSSRSRSGRPALGSEVPAARPRAPPAA